MQTVYINSYVSAVMTYMPQDFRGTLIKQQRERSERNKQAEVEALVNSGGSIRDRYALLWKQQMNRWGWLFLLFLTHRLWINLHVIADFFLRRRQLAQLGFATGVYKTLVKYLVGVPQVFLALPPSSIIWKMWNFTYWKAMLVAFHWI